MSPPLPHLSPDRSIISELKGPEEFPSRPSSSPLVDLGTNKGMNQSHMIIPPEYLQIWMNATSKTLHAVRWVLSSTMLRATASIPLAQAGS